MLARFKAADLDGNGELPTGPRWHAALLCSVARRSRESCRTGVIDRNELRVLLEGFEDGKVAPGEVGSARAPCVSAAYLPAGSAH
jgi:hypothetical protein